jgi:tripartite-type tricarboxylate transporter receptor subunit TctC
MRRRSDAADRPGEDTRAHPREDHREVSEIITTPDIRAKLKAQLMEPIPTSPAEFRARIDADIARWSPVIRPANIRIN